MLLSGDEIRERSGEIFPSGCFSESCLRAAAYDLRILSDPKLETTGSLSGKADHLNLTLGKGQRAVLETFEQLCLPWDLAGNIGVKYTVGVGGLFVSPGLFVDPGFGRDEELVGSRLRFVVTNIGSERKTVRLGDNGEHVISIQFLRVPAAANASRRGIKPPDVKTQGLAFFEDLAKIETDFRGVEQTAERTATAMQLVSIAGVFAIAASLFGVAMSAILSTLSAGQAQTNLVQELNALDDARWTTIALICCFVAISLALVVIAASAVCRFMVRLWRSVQNQRHLG